MKALCGLLVLVLFVGATGSVKADPVAYPYCPTGIVPSFQLGFGQLKARLLDVMGDPLECEHTDDATGDTYQLSSSGMAVFRAGMPSFVAGPARWALIDGEVFRWPESLPGDRAVASGALLALSAPVNGSPAGASVLESATMVPSQATSRAPANDRFLIVNMHGALFHAAVSDLGENVAYARWLGAGTIRVFGTDSNLAKPWDGRTVGAQVAKMAPLLRQDRMKLIVAFVNNHRPVPGEDSVSWGPMDGYLQLLLPFYQSTWQGAYLAFIRDLITTVQQAGALDVVAAWELGNEIHTPRNPVAVVSFIRDVVAQVRLLDPTTPILPGSMGTNHLDPWNRRSPIARWLYCEAPIDAYTLHAYDWVNGDRQGDMPIAWDLDMVTSQPCPSGRRLPVIVEELGTSRRLDTVYGPADEATRLQQEQNQLQFVLRYPIVQAVGVWSGESPRVRDRTYQDNQRGLTSYGLNALGGGSCYDPAPEQSPAARCQLEHVLQRLPNVS